VANEGDDEVGEEDANGLRRVRDLYQDLLGSLCENYCSDCLRTD